MSQKIDRIAVNAAIEVLISQNDENGEAARTVIAYGSELQRSGFVTFESVKSTKSSGKKMSGYSPGHGDVPIQDQERKERKEWQFGIHKERIGYFRLWKEDEGELCFHHFWQSSIATKSCANRDPDVYVLGYETTSLQMEYFAIERLKTIWTFSIGRRTYTVQLLYLEEIYGKSPKICGIRIHSNSS
ncbi:MAG: hypothetical protein AAB407_02645 [Patescibacteria group bacterium]